MSLLIRKQGGLSPDDSFNFPFQRLPDTDRGQNRLKVFFQALVDAYEVEVIVESCRITFCQMTSREETSEQTV